MKYLHRFFIYTLFITITLHVGCNSQPEESTPEEIAIEYINALNASDFEKINSNISDSILTVEGDFIVTNSRENYYVHFQWDSVFVPNYKVIETEKITENSLEITLSKECKRIHYLHDTATVYKVLMEFEDHQITKITTTDYLHFDFTKWQSRRDTLVAWIDQNHPELNGFVFDQSALGAKNYLKAIELYREDKE
jgi:hypothetical protein